MQPERSRRIESLKLTAMQRAPINFCFLEMAGHAMLWEKVRRMAEDLAGYTIRESDVGEAGKYGVEVLANAAHVGRQFNVTYRLEARTSPGHVDNRG